MSVAAATITLLPFALAGLQGGGADPAQQASPEARRQEAELVDLLSNRVSRRPLPAISDRARRLHETLIVADLHADTLLWGRDLLRRADRGHVDLPRLQAGNVALQVFASVTKVPANRTYDLNTGDTDEVSELVVAQGQPERTHRSLIGRSLWHAEKLAAAERTSRGELRSVRKARDIDALLRDRARERRITAGLLAVEGLHNLEGNIANLDRLFAAGFRMAAPVHFFDNEVGGSAHGVAKGGLTPFGVKVVRKMQRRGMIVDVAHASPALMRDILRVSTRPVVSSHGGVQATCPGPRNLSDDQIRAIARGGGLIGIGYWQGAVCDISPAGVAAAIAHVRAIVGINHVALGSDYDGGIEAAFDTAGLAHLTQALLDRDFSHAEIRKVMGSNLLAFLRDNLPH